MIKFLCVECLIQSILAAQYPFRHVQIILRLYHSPGEILVGFDVDASCVLYNGTLSPSLSQPWGTYAEHNYKLMIILLGQDVFAAPRAIVAMMRQCNTVDLTRRSPSYEYRLLKYRHRGYEVRYPQLRRQDVCVSVCHLDCLYLNFPACSSPSASSFIVLNFPIYQRDSLAC